MPDYYLDLTDIPRENQKEYVLTYLEMHAEQIRHVMGELNKARNTMNSHAMEEWRLFEYIVCRLNRDMEDMLREIQYAREE